MSAADKPLREVSRVTIVGTGLLGGSIGLGLRAAGFGGEIIGVGRRQSTIDAAVKHGCIDAGVTDVTDALKDANDDQHLIILATPLSTFETLFESIAKYDRDGLVITDVGSTKQQVCELASRLLPTKSRFVGSHPMAGSELHGPQYAKADLFNDRLCILTPSGTQSSDSALDVVTRLWQALCMTMTEKSPADHDRLVAVISHLPHAVAVLLVQLADARKAISVAATGFRDTTRVASGDPRVWTDIFTTNRDAVVASIDAFSDLLARFREAVATGSEGEMLKLLEQAKDARDKWLNVK